MALNPTCMVQETEGTARWLVIFGLEGRIAVPLQE